MILMTEKSTMGWLCFATHWSTQANSKYLKDYHKN